MAMRSLSYAVLPTAGQWKCDSDNASVAREDDNELARIDDLLSETQHMPRGASSLVPTLIDLFQALNRWLDPHRGEAAHLGRRDAVRALHEVVRRKLGAMLVDPRDPEAFEAALARAMRTMEALGAQAPYSQEKVLNHRILFRGGHAFQLPWWRERASGDLPLASSARIAGERGERREFLAPTEKASPFIVLENQQIYLTRQHRIADQPGAVRRIRMAGMLLVADGRLEALRLDSGDFCADRDDLRGFLTHLKHHGVDLRALRLIDCGEENIDVSADRFLRSGLPWRQFAKQDPRPAIQGQPGGVETAQSGRAERRSNPAPRAAFDWSPALALALRSPQ